MPRGESSPVIYGQVRRIMGGPKKKKRARLISVNPTAATAAVGGDGVSNTCRQSSRYNVCRLCGARPPPRARLMREKPTVNPVRFPGPSCGCRRFAAVHHAAAAARKSDHVGNGTTRVRIVEFFDETFIGARVPPHEHIRRHLKARCARENVGIINNGERSKSRVATRSTSRK